MTKPPDSDAQILTDARDRARALLDALTHEATQLAATSRFVEGAAHFEDAAQQTRRLIAELDALLEGRV